MATNPGDRGVGPPHRAVDKGHAAVTAHSAGAYDAGSNSHLDAMKNHRNNPAANSALPSGDFLHTGGAAPHPGSDGMTRVASSSDTRGQQAGVKINEKPDRTKVEYPDGSKSDTVKLDKDHPTTFYNNGGTVGQSQEPNGPGGGSVSTLEHKGSDLGVQRKDSATKTDTTYFGRQGVEAEQTDNKVTGKTDVKETPPPANVPGYNPKELNGYEYQYGNRVTL
jgi:hypothetical protein